MPTTRPSPPILVGRRELARICGNVSYGTMSCWLRSGLDVALVERGGAGAKSSYDLQRALSWFKAYSASRPWLKLDERLLIELLPPKPERTKHQGEKT